MRLGRLQLEIMAPGNDSREECANLDLDIYLRGDDTTRHGTLRQFHVYHFYAHCMNSYIFVGSVRGLMVKILVKCVSSSPSSPWDDRCGVRVRFSSQAIGGKIFSTHSHYDHARRLNSIQITKLSVSARE